MSVTDDEIRALRERCLTRYFQGEHNQWDTINLCRSALLDHDQSARERCAEAIKEGK